MSVDFFYIKMPVPYRFKVLSWEELNLYQG